MANLFDDFVGTNGADLNTLPGWSRHPTATTQSIALTGTKRVYSNVASGRAIYINSWVPPSANYVVSSLTNYQSSIFSTQYGLCGRLDPSAFTCYLLLWDDGTPTTFDLYKVVAGSGTFLTGATTAVVPGTSRLIQLTMNGSTISAQYNGVTICSTTDTSITAAGFAGLSTQNQMTATTGMQGGAFYAGDGLVPINRQPVGGIDATRRFATTDTIYRQTVVADKPTIYWPLDRTAYAEDFRATTSPFIGSMAATVNPAKGLSVGSQGISCTSTGTVYTPYNAAFNKSTFTVECWVNHSTIGAQQQYIAFLSSDFSSNGWALSYYPAHSAYDFQAYGVNDVLSLKLPVAGIWNHLVCVVNPTINSTYMYLNGVLQGVNVFGYIAASGATPYLSVGGINWPSTGSANFNTLGSVAHFAYYPYVMSPARIAEHYAIGRGAMTPTPQKISQYGSHAFCI